MVQRNLLEATDTYQRADNVDNSYKSEEISLVVSFQPINILSAVQVIKLIVWLNFIPGNAS